MTIPFPVPLVLALLSTCAACAGPAGQRPLPTDWQQSSTLQFEALVDQVGESAEPWEWKPSHLKELEAALDGADENAVRAAVLLGHSPGGASTQILIRRLEQRVEALTRSGDAGDLVAAAALARACVHPPDGPALAERLARLAQGDDPHPDLEVRVECAHSALAAEVDEVIPFLVRVLRADTPAELDDPGDWKPITTLAWAKYRAAQALSRRAGEPCRFRPDGSWEHQMEEAARLERLLGCNPVADCP